MKKNINTEGKYWPHEADREPLVTRFWVPRSPLVRQEGEEFVAGMANVVITETFDQAEERLKACFPVYRVASWGKSILNVVKREGR